LAIDHIKLLKGQMVEKEVENERLRGEMAELKEALERAKIMGSVSSGKSENGGSVRSTTSRDTGRADDVDTNMEEDDNDDGNDGEIELGDG